MSSAFSVIPRSPSAGCPWIGLDAPSFPAFWTPINVMPLKDQGCCKTLRTLTHTGHHCCLVKEKLGDPLGMAFASR